MKKLKWFQEEDETEGKEERTEETIGRANKQLFTRVI